MPTRCRCVRPCTRRDTRRRSRRFRSSACRCAGKRSRRAAPRRVRQQIARELPRAEPVEGHVAVNAAMSQSRHGHACRRGGHRGSRRSRAAREVEPERPCARRRRAPREQPIDEPFVRERRGVGDERVDLGQRRRQACQRQRHTIDQRFLVGFFRRTRDLRARVAPARTGRLVTGAAAADLRPAAASARGAMNAQCGRYSAPCRPIASGSTFASGQRLVRDSGGIRSSGSARDSPNEIALARDCPARSRAYPASPATRARAISRRSSRSPAWRDAGSGP